MTWHDSMHPRTRRGVGPGNSGRLQGFTLVELTVSLTVLMLVVGAALLAIVESDRFVYDEMNRHMVEQTGRRGVERISRELLSADPGTVQPALLTDSSSSLLRGTVRLSVCEPAGCSCGRCRGEYDGRWFEIDSSGCRQPALSLSLDRSTGAGRGRATRRAQPSGGSRRGGRPR